MRGANSVHFNGQANDGDGLVLPVVAQVRVGLARRAPPGGLDGLPPLVGETAAAAGAHGAAGLPLGPVLCGDAAQLLLVLLLPGGVLGLLAGVVRLAARVADRLKKRLVVRPTEAPEEGPGRAVLLQLLHASAHDGQPSLVHVDAPVVRGSLPLPLGEFGQLRDDGVGVARSDAVEDGRLPATRARPRRAGNLA